jgi:DNA-binding MarR family transcriptional regulator
VGVLASDLRVVLGQLMRRLRVEHAFPLSQGSVLGRLDREGSTSIGALAQAERVRPQSMAQTVADLQEAGLVARSSDPSDGRRTMIELTARGRETLAADRRNREGWLAATIEHDLSAQERELLRKAVLILGRIADA